MKDIIVQIPFFLSMAAGLSVIIVMIYGVAVGLNEKQVKLFTASAVIAMSPVFFVLFSALAKGAVDFMGLLQELSK